MVFAISLWLAHELRAVLHFEVFGGTADIAPFEGAYVWISALLLFVAPFILDTQRVLFAFRLAKPRPDRLAAGQGLHVDYPAHHYRDVRL